MTIYSVALVVAAIFMLLTLFLFQNRKLDFVCCLCFVGLCIVLMVISVRTELLEKAAEWLGVYYAPALLFALALIFILGVLLYLAVFLTHLTKRVTRLNQEIAILKEQLEGKEDTADETL